MGHYPQEAQFLVDPSYPAGPKSSEFRRPGKLLWFRMELLSDSFDVTLHRAGERYLPYKSYQAD